MQNAWEEDITRLRKHLGDFEHLLADSKERINQDAKKIPIDEYTEEERCEISADFALEELDIDENIGPFHYRAIFLLICAWFEYRMMTNFGLKQVQNKKNSFLDKLKIYFLLFIFLMCFSIFMDWATEVQGISRKIIQSLVWEV